MGDTQTGTIGRLVVRHAEEDSSNALVPVPILGQQIKGETVACWVQLPKLRDVGRRDAQLVPIFGIEVAVSNFSTMDTAPRT